jgi:hypothetical protein
VAFLVGTQTQLALVQKLNLPVAAAVLAVKMAQETVLLVDQAAAVDLEQQAVVLHHRLGRAVLAAVLLLAVFLAAVVVLVRRGRLARSPLLAAVEMATLIR